MSAHAVVGRPKAVVLAVITAISVGFFGSLFTGTHADAFAQDTSSINLSTRVTNYLDGKIEAVNPQLQFGCGERIHGVIELQGLPSGQHDIAIQWVGPSGKVNHQQNFKFAVSGENQTENRPTYLSSFIEFQSSGGLTSLFDPSVGLDEFIGEWEITVLSHKKALSTQGFSIIC